MKYLVFAGSDFYPSGGAEDFMGAHDSLAKAQEGARWIVSEAAGYDRADWSHVATFDGNAVRTHWRCESEVYSGSGQTNEYYV
jgi:hypothetical protein